MKSIKKIPQFKNEDEERRFWATHDSTEYLDWSKAEQADFPSLKPSTKTISLRLPAYLLDKIKLAAHEQDVPYQSLIKMFLARHFLQQNKSIGVKPKQEAMVNDQGKETYKA
jgi:predicted DNA binding CopG/RHH family protein